MIAGVLAHCWEIREGPAAAGPKFGFYGSLLRKTRALRIPTQVIRPKPRGEVILPRTTPEYG